MKYLHFTLIVFILALNCNTQKQENTKELKSRHLSSQETKVEKNLVVKEKAAPSETHKEVFKYPGVLIDEKFKVLEYQSFENIELNKKTYSIDVESHKIKFNGFTPLWIEKENKTFAKINAQSSEYSSYAIGISKLLGESSKQIYILASSGGAVCCSVFWLIDVSKNSPRTIFRSEEFDRYRYQMEIFDSDNDGIYEISLFDSSFRYMAEDCGSCSPEPRVVFKYDKKKRKYLPVKGIKQDFIDFEQSEKWIKDAYEKIRKGEKFDQKLNYHRTVRAFVVDLIYFGKEKRAWEIFEKYYPKDHQKEENRKEIKKILRQSKFYQALKKS